MTTRTRRATYVFNKPFTLASSGKTHDAGEYIVEREEELVEGISFPVYRYVATTLIPQNRAPGASVLVYHVDRNELADAIASCGWPNNVPNIPPWEVA